jgi:FkbM family methyltransferase
MHYQPRLDDVIIDIGAGRGEDTLAFARRVGANGKVFAIEAHPSTYNRLRWFCELNQLNNVVPLDLAIMNASGTVYIEDGDVWYANTVYASGNGRLVRATTLDQLCNEQRIDRIDFLKMNIEGSEIGALQGMEKTIERIRVICVCCHDFRADRGHGERYRTRKFVTEYLRKHGFSVSRRSSDSRDYVRDHVHGIRDSK